MAINQVSLTAGMRANLLNLQGTVDLLSKTQNRLATGKKVNSALDDPTSFFTATALSARASDIESLKDQMGQAIQTIKAADKGISGVTSLIEQARGIAQKALAVEEGSGNVTQYVTLEGVADTETVTIGGVEFTASTGTDAATNEFEVGATDEETAANLMYVINASAGTPTVTASKVEGAQVYLQAADDMVATSVESAQASITESGLLPAAGAELTTLQNSYNEIRTQIDNMVSDSGYRGKNLVNNDTLTVNFESSSLTVQGFSATAADLDITEATWNTITDPEADITKLEISLSTLRSEASELSLNLGIITAREEFSNNMMNVLTSGADKLTLADMNEEGANMLMLQTKQALGTTALSLSSQASQSVLRLF